MAVLQLLWARTGNQDDEINMRALRSLCQVPRNRNNGCDCMCSRHYTCTRTYLASANLVLSRRPSGEHGIAATWVRASATASRSPVRRNPAQIDATLRVVGTKKLPLSTMFEP